MDRTTRGLVTGLALVATPVAVLQASLLAVSSLGVGLDRGICVALAILALATGMILGHRTWRALDSRSREEFLPVPPGPGGRAASSLLDPAAWTIALLATAFSLVVFLARLATAWRRPVLDWDGLYYHVPAIHAWARSGRITWTDAVPDVAFVNGYPMGLEAIGLWSVQVFGHDRWIDATSLLLWPTAAVAMALFARRIGARGPWVLLAGGAMGFVPAIVLSSATSYVDVGFFAAAAGALALTHLRAQGVDCLPVSILWGVLVGLAMAVKGTGIPLAGLLIAFAMVDLGLGRRGTRRRLLVSRLAVGAAVVGIIGGGWPLRTTVHTGNPLHPIELRLGAKVLAPGYAPHASADLALPEDLRSLPPILRGPAVWLRPFESVHRYDQAEGLGPLWTLAGLPALLLLIHRTWRRRDRATGLLLGVALVWWLAQPAPWWARFTLWALALGWPAAMGMVSTITRDAAAPRKGMALLAVSALLIVSANLGLGSLRSDRATLPSSTVATVDAIDLRWPTLRSHRSFDTALDSDRIARTPSGRVGSLFAGALAQPVGRRKIVVVDPRAVADLASILEQEEIRWLVWDESACGAPPTPLPGGLRDHGGFDAGGSVLRLLERTVPAR